MKTKLDMAHEYAMECLRHMNQMKLNCCEKKLSAESWKYADAMQAESDKREEEKALRDAESHKNFMDMLNQKEQNYHDELVSIGLEGWQPDWSQAPEGAMEWRMLYADVFKWIIPIQFGEVVVDAPSFGYQGNWKDSLRKRP